MYIYVHGYRHRYRHQIISTTRISRSFLHQCVPTFPRAASAGDNGPFGSFSYTSLARKICRKPRLFHIYLSFPYLSIFSYLSIFPYLIHIYLSFPYLSIFSISIYLLHIYLSFPIYFSISNPYLSIFSISIYFSFFLSFIYLSIFLDYLYCFLSFLSIFLIFLIYLSIFLSFLLSFFLSFLSFYIQYIYILIESLIIIDNWYLYLSVFPFNIGGFCNLMHRAKAHRFGHSSTLVLSKTMSFGDSIVSLWFVISAFIRGLITYNICIWLYMCVCIYIYIT